MEIFTNVHSIRSKIRGFNVVLYHDYFNGFNLCNYEKV